MDWSSHPSEIAELNFPKCETLPLNIECLIIIFLSLMLMLSFFCFVSSRLLLLSAPSPFVLLSFSQVSRWAFHKLFLWCVITSLIYMQRPISPFLSTNSPFFFAPTRPSPYGPALLSCTLWFRPRERRWARLQGRRHHHPDQQDRWQLVRGNAARQLRVLPHQLCGYPGAAAPLGRHRAQPCLQRWQILTSGFLPSASGIPSNLSPKHSYQPPALRFTGVKTATTQ